MHLSLRHAIESMHATSATNIDFLILAAFLVLSLLKRALEIKLCDGGEWHNYVSCETLFYFMLVML